MRPAPSAILDHRALAPARQHLERNAGDIAVQEAIFGRQGFGGVDEALCQLEDRSRSCSALSRRAPAKVSERIETAQKKEARRRSAQGVPARPKKGLLELVTQNAGSRPHGRLRGLREKKLAFPMASKTTLDAKNPEALGAGCLAEP